MNNWKDYIDKKIEGISFDEVEIITSEHGEFRSYFKEGTYLSFYIIENGAKLEKVEGGKYWLNHYWLTNKQAPKYETSNIKAVFDQTKEHCISFLQVSFFGENDEKYAVEFSDQNTILIDQFLFCLFQCGWTENTFYYKGYSYKVEIDLIDSDQVLKFKIILLNFAEQDMPMPGDKTGRRLQAWWADLSFNRKRRKKEKEIIKPLNKKDFAEVKMGNSLIGAFYSATSDEMANLLCGIGESEILDDEIIIRKYPFEPSAVYPEKAIKANEIEAVSCESYPPFIILKNEIVFISREYQETLKNFTEINGLQKIEETRNWNWLLEPYADTEYTEETHLRLTALLEEHGISKNEIQVIRHEVEDQMLKYNYDTMLWDWVGLGLPDVLAAMRVKYSKEEFRDFYKRAMEIELRK
jgi:hypothetical protein